MLVSKVNYTRLRKIIITRIIKKSETETYRLPVLASLRRKHDFPIKLPASAYYVPVDLVYMHTIYMYIWDILCQVLYFTCVKYHLILKNKNFEIYHDFFVEIMIKNGLCIPFYDVERNYWIFEGVLFESV